MASRENREHLLVAAQGCDHRAWLFFVPTTSQHDAIPDKDLTRNLLGKQIQQCITPGMLLKRFTRHIVGTAKVVQVMTSSCAIPISSGHGVILENFRENNFSMQTHHSIGDFLDDIPSDIDVKLLHTRECVANDLQGHTALVIRTVLDKTKVATCLLVLSAFALIIGISLAIAFPQAEIGSI
ncbi:MAG: hypothetical protein Q9166_006336, partial [cf. Caloplaca sp. 2 TL-2023]